MIDLHLLRLLKYREDFYRVRGRIPDTAIDPQTRAILGDYDKYFKAFPDHTVVDIPTFMPMFRTWHATLKDDKRASYEAVLSNIKQDVGEDVKREVMRTLLDLRLATDLANVLTKFDAGELSSMYHSIGSAMDAFKADVGVKDIKFIDTDIDDLLQEDINEDGVQSRLQCINESMRPFRPGDFGIIAGRPDRGKTTFVASELTYMAPQLPDQQCVLWLNNEGLGSRIIPRLYQSALGATKTQLSALSQAKLLKQQYIKKLGHLHRIRVIDIHGMDNYSVEQLIESNNPGIVVYDMIDNIRGFGGEARTDLMLEKMYQWGRDCAVKYGHVGFATSQISADGEGMQFPNMSMLKDSKTGKQGACDFIIMVGSSNEPGYNNTRWIGIPKNKLRRDGGPADPRATVKYEPMRARYEDLPMTAEEESTSDE